MRSLGWAWCPYKKEIRAQTCMKGRACEDREKRWPTTNQASLSITNSQSLLKLISTESVMPPNHLFRVKFFQIHFSLNAFVGCSTLGLVSEHPVPVPGTSSPCWRGQDSRGAAGRHLLLWLESCPPNSHVEVLITRTSECDCIGRQGLQRSD